MENKKYFLGAAIVLVALVTYVDAAVGNSPVTDICLGCICNAVSKCDLSQQRVCEGDVCGLFHITWAYWADSGKPKVGGQNTDESNAYGNCAKDARCSAQAVQGYMSRYGQDCNNDGVIDCLDFMAIHKLGGFGCHGYLPPDYVDRFNGCLNEVQKRRQQLQQG